MKLCRFLERAYENWLPIPVMYTFPANDVILHAKRVWALIHILNTDNVSEVEKALINRKYGHMKCSHCYMPVLEHVYDITRYGEEIVLHWKGNCAIGMTRKPVKQLHLIHSTRSNEL